MALEVMHADDRLRERETECIGDRRADQQRPREARSLRVRDPVEVAQRNAALGKHALRERNDALNVIARRELGHHAAVRLMHRHLRMQRVREEAAAGVVDGEPGFVARGFDAENDHGANYRGDLHRQARTVIMLGYRKPM